MEKIVNLSIRTYTHKTENRITFKIKVGCYPDILNFETMKLLGSSKSKIKKRKWWKSGSLRHYWSSINTL